MIPFLEFVCGTSRRPALAAAARAVQTIFPSIRETSGFTHVRRELAPYEAELWELANEAKGATLFVENIVKAQPFLYTLSMVAQSDLVPAAAGIEQRRLLAGLLLEMLAMGNGVPPPGAEALAQTLRQEIRVLQANHSARPPLPTVGTLAELAAWLDAQSNTSGRFPLYFWYAWAKHLRGHARRSVLDPVSLDPWEEIENDADSANRGVSPVGDQEDQADGVFGYLSPEDDDSNELLETPGIRETIVGATLSTYTRLAAFTDASVRSLGDAEISREIQRILTSVDAALQLGRFAKAQLGLARCMVIATSVGSTAVRNLTWQESHARAGASGSLTLDADWFRLPLLTPRQPSADRRKEQRDVWIFLPTAIVSRLRLLEPCPKAGAPVFPDLAASWTALDDIDRGDEESGSPTLAALRWALIQRLARSEPLGLTAAQWVAGDLFGLSPAPLFYDRYPADRFAGIAERIVFPWFNEMPGRTRKLRPTHELALRDGPPLRSVIEFLGHLRPKHPLNSALERARARTRNLVHGLAACTGHRPTDGFGKLRTANFSPIDGLAVLCDKVAGPEWPHRPVALPREWTDEYQCMLRDLRAVANQLPDTEAARACLAALDGSGPVLLDFRMDGTVVPFGRLAYLEGLPRELEDFANFARHSLNSHLIGRVPEALRVAQLGWHGTREGAWANGSPWSVLDVVNQLRASLRDHLKRVGWRRLPDQEKTLAASTDASYPAIDWEQAEQQHALAFRRRRARLRAERARRQSAMARSMRPLLQTFLEEHVPDLILSGDQLALRSGIATDAAVALDGPKQAAMIRALSQGKLRSEEGLVARSYLSGLIRSARSRGVVSGPIPRRPIWSFPSNPSPFIEHAAVALGAIRRLETWLVQELVKEQEQEQAEARLPESVIAFVGILLHGGYGRTEDVIAAMSSRAELRRAERLPSVLLVDVANPDDLGSGAGCLAFHGLAALHLLRWSRSQSWASFSETEFLSLLHKHLPAELQADTPASTVARIGALVRVANSLRMDGVARLIGTGLVRSSNASAARIVALIDEPLVEGRPDSLVAPASRRTGSSAKGDKCNRGIVELFEIVGSGREEGESREAEVRSDLQARLMAWCGSVSGNPTIADLLARFVLALVQRGGQRHAHLKLGTVRDYYYQVASPLCRYFLMGHNTATGDSTALPPIRPSQWATMPQFIIASTTPSTRPARLEALRRFVWVLGQEMALPGVDFSAAAEICGEGGRSTEVGTITEPEFASLLCMLNLDLANLDTQEADPKELKAAKHRISTSLVMRTAGPRISEATGLGPGDIKTDRSPPRILIRGGHNRKLKTPAARRAAGIEGRHASRLLSTLEALYPAAGGTLRSVGSRHGRARTREIGARIAQLLRWATGEARARPHWLRKAAARERVYALAATNRESLWPVREMVAGLGHRSIETTLNHYVHDPVAPMQRFFRTGLSGAGGERVAMAVGRSRSRVARRGNISALHGRLATDEARMAQLLESVATGVGVDSETGVVRLPEALRAGRRFRPSLSDIDGALQLVALGVGAEEVSLGRNWPLGVRQDFVESIALLAREYMIQVGEPLSSQLPGHSTIRPPRRLRAAKPFRENLLKESAGPVLREMAATWLPLAAVKELRGGVPGTRSQWDAWGKVAAELNGDHWAARQLGANLIRTPLFPANANKSLWPYMRWAFLAAFVQGRMDRSDTLRSGLTEKAVRFTMPPNLRAPAESEHWTSLTCQADERP